MNKQYSWFVKLAVGSVLVLAVLICLPISWEPSAHARSGARTADALMGYSFQVQAEGKMTGVFRGCSGIGSISEIVENRAADKGGQQIVQKLPGRVKWSDIVVTRPLTSDMAVNAWRQEVIEGRVAEARRNVVITMYDANGRPVAIWELVRAWPSGLIVNQTTDGGNTMVEELTITYESAARKQ